MKGFPDSLRTEYKMPEFDQEIAGFLTARGFEFSFEGYMKCHMFKKKLGKDFVINGVYYSCLTIPDVIPHFLVQIFVNGHKLIEKEGGFSCGEDILKLIDETCKDAEKILESLHVRLAEYRMTGM